MQTKPFMPNTKIGATAKVGLTKSQLVHNFYARKRILTVPQDILDANPDKHFCYVNMNKLQKNGMWHPQGYRLFKAAVDSESMKNEKFNGAIDPYLHRNEMALAWMPKEEYEMRQAEWAAVRSDKNVTDVITKSNNLQKFSPTATENRAAVTSEGLTIGE